MRIKILSLVSILVLFSSCRSTKVIEGTTTANNTLSTKKIIAAHKAASQNFTTLAARMQVKYSDPKQSQSITTSVRMEKDKAIWIKASIIGITLAKVLITPEEVSFYESIGRTYFKGDFALLSDFLGTDINFQQAQAIFLGQSIIPLDQGKFISSVANNKYELVPAQQDARFLLNLLVNPDTFLVHQEQISQPQENRNLVLDYGPYQKIENSFYPTEIHLEASENQDKTTVDIKYKKIDLNVSLNFPFTIPNGYEEMKLK